ncbi:MAG: YkvA family protein [Paracoccaceae bacterium]
MAKSMNEPLEGEVIAPGVKTPVDEARAANDEENVRRDFWKTFRKALRYIPFSSELVAAYYCALDSKTPFHVRATLLAALAYFVMPLDVVPDFIFGLGFSDDITVLAATLMRLRSYITDEHRDEAKKALDDI